MFWPIRQQRTDIKKEHLVLYNHLYIHAILVINDHDAIGITCLSVLYMACNCKCDESLLIMVSTTTIPCCKFNRATFMRDLKWTNKNVQHMLFYSTIIEIVLE